MFIASRLKFRRRIVTISVAVSYFVMIIAMAVSSGFRCEVRNALSLLGGDIQLCPANLNFLDEARPVDAAPSYLPLLEEVDGVESVEPVVYRAGIVKLGDNIQGVMVKGVPSSDSTSLSVSIPRRLSEIGGIGVGDKMLTYFVGEKVKVRNFTVASIYDPAVEAEDRLVGSIRFRHFRQTPKTVPMLCWRILTIISAWTTSLKIWCLQHRMPTTKPHLKKNC